MNDREKTMLLESQGLQVSIADKPICHSLNLQVAPGQSWGILGINGVGKTTLLQTLAGLRQSQAGTITLQGDQLSSLDRRQIAKQIGVLFQDYHDPFPATVMETTLIGRHPHLGHWQWEDEEDIEFARQALIQMEMGDLEERFVDTLSGGERRRLAIATLLTQEPQLFLLDEPANHLDPHHQISVLDLINQQVVGKQKAAVMILHDINQAIRFCDHLLLMMGDGEILQGPTKEILNESLLQRLYGHTMIRLAGPNGDIWFPG